MEIYEIINGYKPENYLEVGIFRGDTFYRVESRIRVGVDPSPSLDLTNLSLRLEGDYVSGSRTLIHPVPSDEYFSNKDKGGGIKFDVIFIDGMHEYRQSLRDIGNSVEVLRGGGVILVHDVNPLDEVSASIFSDAIANVLIRGGHAWNGDVYRAMTHLRRVGIEFETIDIVHGLSVIKKGGIEGKNLRLGENLGNISFEEFSKVRHEILGLKSL